MKRDTSHIGRRAGVCASPLVGLALTALLVGAAGPASAQTEPSPPTTTASVSAPAPAEAPAAEAEPATAPEAVKAKADAAMDELDAEAAKAKARAADAPAKPAPAPVTDEATPEPVAKEESAKPPGATPKADAAKEGESATSGDQAKNVLVRNIADAPVGKRPWFLSGTLAFRGPAVADQDPANDMSLSWIFQAGHRLGTRGLTVFGQLRLTQRFVADEGDSAFRFQDVQAGVNYIHQVDLKELIGVDRKISFFHRAAAFFPTSRISQNGDLVIAPRLLSRGRVKVIGDLYFGFTGLVEYRWHEFAATGGNLGMNTQAVLAAQGALEYQVLQSKDWGVVVIGADTYGGANFEYADQDGNRSTLPFFGWDLYAQYVPIPTVAVGISLEQGEPVFQNGNWRIQFFDREATQVAISVTGRY